MSQKAYITPEVLKWARETAKMSREEAAKNITTPAKLERWESGADLPSIRQARELARKYRRPLATFYLPEPPEDFQTLRDFRKNDHQSEYSTALTFIIREIQAKQEWLRDMLIQEGAEQLPFIGRFSMDSDPNVIANDIKQELGIEESPKTNNLFKYWREKIEAKRIFVSLTKQFHSHLKIDVKEVKGFAISDELAPFIFVNTYDYQKPKLFTLIHELVHLWLDVSGVSDLNTIGFRDELNTADYDPAEIFCNEVTGHILMPEASVRAMMNETEAIDVETVKDMAQLFWVSPKALSVRLLNLGLLSKKAYFEIGQVLEDEFEACQEREAAKEKPSKDLPLYYVLTINRNSKAFTHFVYDQYKSGEISGSEASQLLNIKVNKFDKLEAELAK